MEATDEGTEFLRRPKSANIEDNIPSIEMSTVFPTLPKDQPVDSPSAVAFAAEKFETAHITIFQAARDGQIDIVKRKLLKSKRDVNNKDENNTTALHYAVRFNHFEIVKHLIKKGANPNLPGEDGATSLHYAARYKPLHLLKKSRSAIELKKSRSAIELCTPEVEKSTYDLQNDYISRAIVCQCLSLHQLCLSTSDSNLNIPDSVDGGQDSSQSVLSYLLKKTSANVNIQDNYGSTPLHYAAQKGTSQSVEEILKHNKVHINAQDKRRATPLHEACSQGNLDVAKLLMKNGAELQARDKENMTPLHHAASSGQEECVKALLDAAESSEGKLVEKMIMDVDREGQTALHVAVNSGSCETARYILVKGAEVNAVQMNMSTPLHLAATIGDVEIVGLLLNFKANVEAKNVNQETPLHKAALFDSVPIIDLLLQSGADIESRNKDSYTPLLVAVAKGNMDSTSALLGHQASIGAKESSEKSAMFIAAEENCLDVLKLLLKNESAEKLLQECDKYENTPLHIAAKRGFINAVRLLLDEGADIDAVNLEEKTALHLAAMNGKENIVRELIKRGGTIIHDEDDKSNTALHLAATHGHYRVIEVLLDKGAPVDARNLLFWTPLNCAANRGWISCVRVLLESDAPVDPIDKCNMTPLHLAASAGHVDIVRLLMSYHADISLCDSTGRNALDMAIDESHKACAFAILDHDNWREAMRNRSFEHGTITTPLRKMIMKEPEIAEVVFNKCVALGDEAPDSLEFTVTLDYEFLEDIYADWQDDDDDGDAYLSQYNTMERPIVNGSPKAKTNTIVKASDYDDTILRSKVKKQRQEYQSVEFKTAEEIQRDLEKKKNHPLMLMVKHGRENLITHPLVVFLLDSKWSMFGRKLFYLKLLVFLVFLLFLTGYVIVKARESPIFIPRNATTQAECRNVPEKDTLDYKVFIEAGRYILLIMACLHVVFELFQLVYERLQYFADYTNLFEMIMYMATIIYVSADFELSDFNAFHSAGCSQWHINVGALAIFLTWIVLVLFLRKFPMFGIYIVMLEDIMLTFLRFSVILGLLTVAFGLSFYTLLHRYWETPFKTPGLSLLKTFVMVIGEYDYDTGFSDNIKEKGEHPPAFAYVLFVLFIVVMTILLMNLLVGLAVDDIKEVQALASFKRQAMLVDMALNVEKAFPRFLRMKLVTKSEIRHPNWLQEKILGPLNCDKIRGNLRQEKTPFEKIEIRQEEVKETVRVLKTNVSMLSNRTERMESMLNAIVGHLNVQVNEDELDNYNY